MNSEEEATGTTSIEEQVSWLRQQMEGLLTVNTRLVTEKDTLESEWKAKQGEWEAERALLELRVKDLRQQLYGRKTERHVGEEGQRLLFEEPEMPEEESKPEKAGRSPVGREPGERKKKGPKPLDPSLPRETINVPAPELKELVDPVTGRLMKPGFTEVVEVLARRPAVYYVRRYERTVFVNAGKAAPVYSPWPPDVLVRSRVHASVVAHVAAAHFCEHTPYYRLEKHLERLGVSLPRSSQVSLMKQLDGLAGLLVKAMKDDVFRSGYVMADATSVRVQDPERPGGTREGTLWAFRNEAGTVWFLYTQSKSPKHPDGVLKEVDYSGLLQTDGAEGLGSIGPPGKIITHGCLAHLRRYFVKACKAGDRSALPWLKAINRLFRMDRLAACFRLKPQNRQRLREGRSLPVFDAMVRSARNVPVDTLPKSPLGKAVHYLLEQQEPLRRTVANARVELSTNAVERAIRPLKLGSKNWMHVGHPEAGPRLANLFTLVENCRLLGIDPEAYLIDVLTRLADHPAKRVDEWLPRRWKQARPDATSAWPVSGEDRCR
ncbi:Transposase IS66 family [Opitutaceae bacterium TAV1]|nr:Transposase IS66 family [Opitutaceae bacterium TAV1]